MSNLSNIKLKLNEANIDDTGLTINAIFRNHGLTIFDKTPDLSMEREREIEAWLADHPQVERFVVLDDQFLDGMGFLKDHLIKTSNFRCGLAEEEAQNAIERLNR